jgi:hypothetical protein
MTLSTYAGANSVELPILAELIVMFDFLAASEDFLEENTPCADRILFLNMAIRIVDGYNAAQRQKQKGQVRKFDKRGAARTAYWGRRRRSMTERKYLEGKHTGEPSKT